MKFTHPPDSRPVDGYTIRRGIHRGGFGEVYYAVSDAGKDVALKLLTHDLDTELRGVRQCLNLKHPNLVTIFDVRTDGDGDIWVMMEYISGASLEDILHAFPQGLPLSEVRDWMTGILAGVEYLHSRGIVHRDLKPANIYRENGLVKIGDVGLSKQMGATRRQHTEAIGTIYYMAPEVARGQYGVEVDIYSIGVLLFELLTGRLPFEGETTAEILMKHLSAAPDLSPIPENLRPVLSAALAKDPNQRIRSTQEFSQKLQSALKHQPIPESAFEAADEPGTAHQPFSYSAKGRRRSAENPVTDGRPSDWQSWKNTARTQGRSLVREILDGVRSRVRHTVDQAVVRERYRELDRRQRAELKNQRREEKEKARRSRQYHRDQPAAAQKTYLQRYWFYLVLAFALFVPWHRLSWNDAGEMAATVALWGGLLVALDYLSRPASQSRSLTQPAHAVGAAALSPLETASMIALVAPLSSGLLMLAGISTLMQRARFQYQLQTNDILWLALSASLATLILLLPTILVNSQPRVQQEEPWKPSRATMLGLGLCTGLAVGGLSHFLMARDFMAGPARPLFSQMGQFPLALGGRSTIVAYVLFFGLLFWVQNWNRILAPLRKARLRLLPIFSTTALAIPLSFLTGIATPTALLWAAVIAASTQLAAPWRSATRSIPVSST